MKTVGLDTSVVVRLLTGLPPELTEAAKRFIVKMHAEKRRVVVSDLVVAEAYFAMVHHYSASKPEALGALCAMLESGFISPESGGSALETLKSGVNAKAGFVDQLIRNQYLRMSEEIVTFDADFGKMEKVTLLKK